MAFAAEIVNKNARATYQYRLEYQSKEVCSSGCKRTQLFHKIQAGTRTKPITGMHNIADNLKEKAGGQGPRSLS